MIFLNLERHRQKPRSSHDANSAKELRSLTVHGNPVDVDVARRAVHNLRGQNPAFELMHSWGVGLKVNLREEVFAETKEGICIKKILKSKKKIKRSAS